MAGRGQLFTLSIGGSILVPDGVDVPFARRLCGLLRRRLRRGDRFLLTVGGGALARERIAAARRAGLQEGAALHRIGMSAAVANARFLHELLGTVADPQLYPSGLPPVTLQYRITFFLPERPGRTTDENAVRAAIAFHCPIVFNLTNVSQVFDRDPRRFRSARPLPELSWTEYRALIPRAQKPGMSTPFDPVSSRAAARAGLTVVVLDGRDLRNLERALDDERFRGTVIHP